MLPQIFQHRLGGVERERVLFQKDAQALDVVGVLMGDEDALQLGKIRSQLLQGGDSGTAADAKVDEQRALSRIQIGAVAAAAAVKRTEYCHRMSPLVKTDSAKHCSTAGQKMQPPAPKQRERADVPSCERTFSPLPKNSSFVYAFCAKAASGTTTLWMSAPRPCSLPTRSS